jgi:hypothetical protein
MMRGPTIIIACTLASLLGCAAPSTPKPPSAAARIHCPELTWQRFPSDHDMARDDQGLLANAERISYQLRVFDQSTGHMVFERTSLNETRHRPELWLDPDHRHVWTVRPVFWLGRDRRVGDWLGVESPLESTSETARSTAVPLPLRLFPPVPTDRPPK